MKTYTKTIQEPRLKITHDSDPISPREDTNLGYFITCEKRHFSPDSHEALESMIKATGDEANTLAEHIKLITEGVEAITHEKVLVIYPVVKYEQGGVLYKLGTTKGFDYSNNGFYIVTDKTVKEYGYKGKDFEKVIRNELDTYNKYVNGEVYSYILYDENGVEIDGWRGGFYSLDDIKDDLGREYKDEDLSEYVTE